MLNPVAATQTGRAAFASQHCPPSHGKRRVLKNRSAKSSPKIHPATTYVTDFCDVNNKIVWGIYEKNHISAAVDDGGQRICTRR
jgi:hypothetical protein